MKRWVLGVAALATVWAPLPLHGQSVVEGRRDTAEVETPRFVLPEIRTRVGTATLYTARVVGTGPVRWSAEGLGDWLSALPGVLVRGRGVGGRETVSIRGSRAADVRVTLDGIPLNDPLTGAADLSMLPAATLESGTVTRGAGRQPGWGGTAGSVELRSRGAEPGVHVRAFAGSLGHRGTDLTAGWLAPGAEFSLFARGASSNNDFQFENRIHPDNPVELRRNADYELWNVLGRLALEAVPLTALVRADDVDRGAPGRMGNHLWDEARWGERRTAVSAGWNAEGPLSGTVGWARTDQRYSDPRTGREEDVSAEQVDVTGSAAGPLGLRLDWNGTWAHLAGERTGTRTRWTGGVRAGRGFALGETVTLHGAAMLDGAAEGFVVSPSVGLTVTPQSGWTLRARASQARRLPTFGDLFLRPGAGVRPNAELTPERVLLDAEIGVEWRRGALEASSAVFHRRVRDPIVWMPSVLAIWTPSNLGTLRAAGLETALSWRPGEPWAIQGALTLQSSRLHFEDASSTPLPYEPAVSGRLAVTHHQAQRTWAADVRIVGQRHTSFFGPHDLPAYGLLNFRVRQTLYLLGFEGEVEFGVENALDTRYERIELFPEPGRRFEIAIGIHTGRGRSLQTATSSRSLPNASDMNGESSSTSRSRATSGL